MKKIKRIIFTILLITINLFNVTLTKAQIMLSWDMNHSGMKAYWVTSLDNAGPIFEIISKVLSFFIIPIIFFIWLYFFLTKKTDKKRKRKAIILFVITIILTIVALLGKAFSLILSTT